jgi:pimeloyl-ACP methyl ester carboxylesterase
MSPPPKRVQTDTLEIAYEDSGNPGGPPVVLMHGFPDDARTWDGVVAALATAGYRVVVPYLRGYGPTRFLHAGTPRSGQQAALGRDLLDLMDGVGLDRPTLVGYDWGGRAACIVAALWPQRVHALVTINGYSIQNIAASRRPASPPEEFRYWYQWYFHTERGQAGLQQNRRELCRLLWQLWSPNLRLDDQTYDRTAESFDNPDFVAVVVHSYRHRYLAAPGDPALAALEERLAAQPVITVPTVVLHGACDGVDPPEGSVGDARYFSGPYRREVVPSAGHFLPRESPDSVVRAVRELAP